MISYIAKKINNKYVKALQDDIRKQLEEEKGQKEQERISKLPKPIGAWSSGQFIDGSLRIPSPTCGSMAVRYGVTGMSGATGCAGISGTSGPGPGWDHKAPLVHPPKIRPQSKYSNYLSEQMDKIEYNGYLSDSMDKSVDYVKYLSDKLDNSWMNQYAVQHNVEPKRIISLEDPYGEEMWEE